MLSYTTLQEGYKALKSLTNACKDSLQKDLQGGKTISAADSDWLDIDANLIDEEVALDQLKSVANLEEAIGLLPDHLKKAVEGLITLGSPPGESDPLDLQQRK